MNEEANDAKAVELYRRFRPKSFDDVIGQPEAVSQLEEMLENKRVPHALLMTGASGTGKTTAVRILKRELDCNDKDFEELNIADARGIDTVRDIRNRMMLSPIGGKCKIFLLDECQKSTPDFQGAILKVLEDTPGHVYFMLCTTDETKLLKAIRTRCTQIQFKPVSEKDLAKLINSICIKISIKLNEEVASKIAEVAEGSPRKALVILHQIAGIKDSQKQLDLVQNSNTKEKSHHLARALLNPQARWNDIAKMLKEIEEEPETVRHMVLGYMNSVVLSGGKLAGRAASIIANFSDPFFNNGKDGLTMACWDSVHNKDE